MGTARVTFPMVVVMITPDIGVEVQLACCQCFCCCISVAGNTTIKPDTHIAQCHLGTAANTAGGMVSWGCGRFLPKWRRVDDLPQLPRVRRWGSPILLLSWLPLLGGAQSQVA